MKTICLALNRFQSPKEVHAFLKEQLSFPEYYGNNLDALHDELTSIQQPLTICLHCGFLSKKQEEQWRPLLRFLHDISEENPRITVIE